MLHFVGQGSNEILDTAQTVTEIVTPYLPFIGTVAGAALVGIFAIWNRKRGAVETRAPDVNEIWQQQAQQSKELDIERRLRRLLEDMYTDLREAFNIYVRRVHRGGNIELTDREARLLNKETPTPENIKLPTQE